MTRSLAVRLAAGAVLFIGLALFLIWNSLGAIYARHVVSEYRSEYQAVIDGMAARIDVTDGVVTLGSEPADQRYDIPAGGRYWQISGPDGIVARSRSLWDSEIGPPKPDDPLFYQPGPGGGEIMVMARELTYGEGPDAVTVAIAAAGDASEIEESIAAFRWDMAKMLALAAALLAVASLFQIVVGLSPLRALRSEIGNVRSGLRERMDNFGPSETGPLVEEINDLLAERALAVENARARAADLAHGLKTPLTVIAHVGEKLASRRNGLSQDGEQLLEQVDTVRKRVDRQLALARIQRAPAARTELAKLSEGLAKAMKPISNGKAIDWDIDVDTDCVAMTDPADAAEALGNVLDNAMAWTAARIRVEGYRGDGIVGLRIQDDGPGICADRRREVLERGGRLDEARPGTGLGLTISSEILAAVGGRLALSDSPYGGLEVVMEWPAAPVA